MKKWSQRLIPSSYPGEKPDFVKNASYPDSYDNVSDDGFALIWMDKNASHRMFAVSTPHETWMSGDFLAKAWTEFPHEAAVKAANKISAAATEFDVQVPEIIHKAAELDPMSDNLYVYTGESDIENLITNSISAEINNTNTIKVANTDYTIANAAELNAAENWFERNHTSMGFADRLKLAYFIDYSRNQILKSEKIADERFSSGAATQYSSKCEFNTNLGNELLKRASYCHRTADPKLNQDAAATYIKLATEVNGVFEENPIEVVAAIEKLDKFANIGELWGIAIPDPIETVLVTPISDEQKVASENEVKIGKMAGMEDAYSIADALNLSVPNRDITFGDIRKSASSGRLAQMLGEKLASMLATNPMQTFEALPAHLQQVVLHESFRG
jgi:hypothetical protein